jgi:hypothetical protein
MPAPPSPYFVYIDLFKSDGVTRPNQTEIARVRAYDVNGSVVTWEGESGFNSTTGGWYPVYMQNIAAFYPPREKPNLKFEVWSTAEQIVHTTQLFNNIPSESTVRIVIGQSDELVGGGAGGGVLTFTGNAKVVVHAKTATKEQRFQIAGNQNPGTLAGTVGAIYDVTASGSTPWTLKLQLKEGATFVDRPLIFGPFTTQDNLRIQFVVPSGVADITARVEQAVSQPGTGTTFGMVRGRVTDPNLQPLANVTVSLFARKAPIRSSAARPRPARTGATSSSTSAPSRATTSTFGRSKVRRRSPRLESS